MKQGRASRDVREGGMRSPYSHADNVRAVSQIGQAMGNHSTDLGSKTLNSIESLGAGRGFTAPQPKSRQYHQGSQGGR